MQIFESVTDITKFICGFFNKAFHQRHFTIFFLFLGGIDIENPLVSDKKKIFTHVSKAAVILIKRKESF